MVNFLTRRQYFLKAKGIINANEKEEEGESNTSRSMHFSKSMFDKNQLTLCALLELLSLHIVIVIVIGVASPITLKWVVLYRCQLFLAFTKPEILVILS